MRFWKPFLHALGGFFDRLRHCEDSKTKQTASEGCKKSSFAGFRFVMRFFTILGSILEVFWEVFGFGNAEKAMPKTRAILEGQKVKRSNPTTPQHQWEVV